MDAAASEYQERLMTVSAETAGVNHRLERLYHAPKAAIVSGEVASLPRLGEEPPKNSARGSGIDKEKLRLFFLSVLWRAASSSLEELSSIKVSKNELEKLRIMILLKSIKPLSFFPCQLTQLTTKGITHNQSPIQSTIPSLDSMKNNNAEKDLSVFRFYFDGLVTNIYLNMQLNDYDVKKIGGVFVGAEESIIVTAVPFDKSLQINRLFSVITKNMDDIIS